MLPAALYLCSLLSPRELVLGHARADGTLQRLDVRDHERCLILQKTSAERAAHMAMELFGGEASPDCYSFFRKSCNEILTQARREPAVCKRFDEALCGDPLGRALREAIDEVVKEGLCTNCTKMLRDGERDLRKAFWEKLPRLVGVKAEAV